MSKRINDKFNKELNEKQTDSSKNEYGNDRLSDHTVPPDETDEEATKINWLLPLLLIAVLMFGTHLMTKVTKGQNSQPVNTEKLIQQYFASNEIQYVDNNRGSTEIDPMRTQAATSYQDKDYVEAASSFDKIKTKTIQDQFFQAYSFFKINEYEKAAIEFANLISKNRDQETYLAEAKLYQVFSLIQLGQYEKAKMLYDNLKAGSWEKKELRAIVESFLSK